MEDVLKKLENDSNYYGDFGKKWLSNSDIITLLNDPKNFRKQKELTNAMLLGRYFHTGMLEPHKVNTDEFNCVDVTSRNTNKYKEVVKSYGLPLMMLSKEKQAIDKAMSTMKNNLEFYDAIYDEENVFEVPAVQEIMGVQWKGKADIVAKDCLIDLKTTSKIKDFKYSAKKYNYDSQAYIYQQLFDKPLIFYVVDKLSFELGIYYPSSQFLNNGKDKVERAVEIYNQFYSENAIDSIDDYINRETL